MGQKEKPWEAIGMSRTTWYRRGKPTANNKRVRQPDIAASLGLSLRTYQRTMLKQLSEKIDAVGDHENEMQAAE
jgi:hypothetical protein